MSETLDAKKDNSIIVNVAYDRYHKKSKSYRGFSIQSLVDSIIQKNRFDTASAYIQFECTDGYRPSLALKQLYQGANGFLVFKDFDTNWPDSIKQKLGPYYLVWDNVKSDDYRFTWPYGIVSIRLLYFDAWPTADLKEGFDLFRRNCMQCHSVNGIGGVVGPEFAYPRNITSYWSEDNLIMFAKDPRSFRYNSQMPPISYLSDTDLKKIVRYIKSAAPKPPNLN
ncbi:MAG: c-type cytochrome [Bacteroidota bacterium]